METFLRRLEILRYLQQRNAANLEPAGTDQIIQHLIDGDYVGEEERDEKSLMRLIQRDLKFLLGEYDEEDDSYFNHFDLRSIRGQRKTLLWEVSPYHDVSYEFEKMPSFMALALTLTRKHLNQVLPSAIQNDLAQLFFNAEHKMKQSERKLNDKQYTRLSNAVEFYQRGQSLRTPDFDMHTLDNIYQAILNGRRVKFAYQTSNGRKEYDVHPFGVTIMLPKLYLVGVKDDDARDGKLEEFRTFLIHRIEDLEVSRFSNAVPEDFKLKEYLDAGNTDVLVDRDANSYDLEVDLYTQRGSHLLRDLQDSPLNETQSLNEISDGHWRLSARVKHTVQLRNWLLALGAQAKVTAPQIIRNELSDYLSAMQQHYT